MKIIVLGGGGHLGSRTVDALRAAQRSGRAIEVEIAGRSGPCAVDLRDPSTFERLRGAAVVLDLASRRGVSPNALGAWCVEAGIVLVCASSDRGVVESLGAQVRDLGGPGAVVLGGGIFTGLSNQLAASVAARVPGCESLLLGVASSPLSASGAGTVALMVDSLDAPSVRFEAGRRVEGPSIGAPIALPFASGAATGLTVGFPEAPMLHASSKVPNVRVAFSPRPALLRYAFAAIPASILGSGPVRVAMQLYFTVLRRFLLAWRTAPVELVCVARGGGEEARAGLLTEDGMRAGGGALAAQAIQLAEAPPRGLQYLDAVVPLAETITLANALLPARAQIRSA